MSLAIHGWMPSPCAPWNAGLRSRISASVASATIPERVGEAGAVLGIVVGCPSEVDLEPAFWCQTAVPPTRLLPVRVDPARNGARGHELERTRDLFEVGSRGDSYDNAMAESLNGTVKAELVKLHGPWRTRGQLEIAD